MLLSLSACFVPREPDGRPDDACTSCHGEGTQPAPPRDLRGNTGVEFPGVGSHLRHLVPTSSSFRPVSCEQCHPVPSSLSTPGHNDGVTQLTVKWSPGPRTCEGTCHGQTSGVWTRPREESCGTCHGLPPAAPHPQTNQCTACHGALDAGTHVDGTVQTVTARCDACHGIPPASGAHAKHPKCETCHVVPDVPVTPLHPNGGRAELTLPGWNPEAQTCTTGCHVTTSPPWTSSMPATCDTCHRSPPAEPHPQATLAQCTLCHAAPSAPTHVDGKVDVAVPATCDGCHATIPDESHRIHLVGRGLGRPVQCSECHAVPQQVVAPRHVDGTVELTFSGVAVSNLASPSYANRTCTNTACHDLSNIVPGGGGGTNVAPTWGSTDGGQVTCTSCHGMPPPAPHPVRSDCDTCHATGAAVHVNGRVDFD